MKNIINTNNSFSNIYSSPVQNFLNLKKCFLLITILFYTTSSMSQSWQWIKSGGSDDELDPRLKEGVVDMTADNFGNVCLLSSVGSSLLQVDGNPKTAYCNSDVQSFMIASFGCDGAYNWSKVIGGNNGCIMRGIETDAEGNIYAVGETIGNQGYFIDPVYFDNDVILPMNCDSNGYCVTDFEQLFLIKYNKNGVFQWLKRPQASGLTYGEGFNNISVSLDVDPQGNIYWFCKLKAGIYEEGAFVNNLIGNNPFGNTFFILKYNTLGEFIGTTPIEFESNYYDKFVLKKNHNTSTYFILGLQDNSPVNQGGSITTIGGVTQVKNRYLAAFDNNGLFLWKKEGTAEINGGEGDRDLCFDNQNNIYYNGAINSPDTFSNSPVFSIPSGGMPMIIKLDSSGNFNWISNSTYGFINSINQIYSNNNEVAIVNGSGGYQWGTFYEPIVPNGGFNATLVRLNKETGVPIAVEKLTSPFGFTETGKTLAADNNGNYYMGGQFEYEITDGTHTALNDGGQTDFFLAKFGTSNCNLNTQNINQNQGLNIYPNPVRNNLFVNDQTTLLKFTLYNLLGTKISSGTLPPLQGQIDFQGLQSGMYLLFLEDTNGFLRKIKVIKE